jgi:hypothetical protein
MVDAHVSRAVAREVPASGVTFASFFEKPQPLIAKACRAAFVLVVSMPLYFHARTY